MSFIYKYPHPAVTTDCVILTFHEERLKLLLIRRGIEPYKGYWALPGGFLRIDESAEECAYRELQEETGVTGCTIKQFHTFSTPSRDPRERVITIAFYALMKWQKATGADDAEYADWIPVDNLPPLAFDHHDIIKLALETIRRDIYFEPVGFELLNDTFSMPELQKVYEAILGKEFDRRNFAKKIKHLNILDEVSTPADPAASLTTLSQSDKSYSLPFLNSNFGHPISHYQSPATFDNDIAIGTQEIFVGPVAFDSDCKSNDNDKLGVHDIFVKKEVPPKSKSRRKGLLFTLNKLKYKNLKKNDELEF